MYALVAAIVVFALMVFIAVRSHQPLQREGRIRPIIMYLISGVLSFGSIVLFALVPYDADSVAPYWRIVLVSFFWLFGIACVWVYFRCEIRIADDRMIFSPMIGPKTSMTLGDLKSVRRIDSLRITILHTKYGKKYVFPTDMMGLLDLLDRLAVPEE